MIGHDDICTWNQQELETKWPTQKDRNLKKKKSSAVITLVRKIHTHVITMTGKSGYCILYFKRSS